MSFSESKTGSEPKLEETIKAFASLSTSPLDVKSPSPYSLPSDRTQQYQSIKRVDKVRPEQYISQYKTAQSRRISTPEPHDNRLAGSFTVPRSASLPQEAKEFSHGPSINPMLHRLQQKYDESDIQATLSDWECPFWFLQCHKSLDTFLEWEAHCQSHLHRKFPRKVTCPFRCCDWSYSGTSGDRAWQYRTEHICTLHLDGSNIIDFNKGPDGALVDHLWRTGIITAAQEHDLRKYGQVRETAISTVSPRDRGAKQKQQLLHLSQEKTKPIQKAVRSAPETSREDRVLVTETCRQKELVRGVRRTNIAAATDRLSTVTTLVEPAGECAAKWWSSEGSCPSTPETSSSTSTARVQTDTNKEHDSDDQLDVVGEAVILKDSNPADGDEFMLSSSARSGEASTAELLTNERRNSGEISPCNESVNSDYISVSDISSDNGKHVPVTVISADSAEEIGAESSTGSCKASSDRDFKQVVSSGSRGHEPQNRTGKTFSACLEDLQSRVQSLLHRTRYLSPTFSGRRRDQSTPRTDDCDILGTQSSLAGSELPSLISSDDHHTPNSVEDASAMILKRGATLKPLRSHIGRSQSEPPRGRCPLPVQQAVFTPDNGDGFTFGAHSFQGGQSQADSGPYFNYSFPNSGNEGNSGGRTIHNKRPRIDAGESDGAGRFPCIFAVGEPLIFGNHKRFAHISLLLRHLESHDFYACSKCLTKFDDSQTAAQHKQNPCVKICAKRGCRRYYPSGTDRPETCACIYTSRQQWLQLFWLQYPYRAPPPELNNLERGSDVLSQVQSPATEDLHIESAFDQPLPVNHVPPNNNVMGETIASVPQLPSNQTTFEFDPWPHLDALQEQVQTLEGRLSNLQREKEDSVRKEREICNRKDGLELALDFVWDELVHTIQPAPRLYRLMEQYAPNILNQQSRQRTTQYRPLPGQGSVSSGDTNSDPLMLFTGVGGIPASEMGFE